MMKAKMTVLNSSIGTIQSTGGSGQSQAGHEFAYVAQLSVAPRSLGSLSGEGIDCPELQWLERIEWHEFDPTSNSWIDRGEVSKDMYAARPTSNTFAAWNRFRYGLATTTPNAPPALAAIRDEKEAKHWIARHGFTWNLIIIDPPAMALRGGGHGGGGESLVIGPSRRRVIHFDIGFTGGGPRVQATQILETLHGNLTIHKFVTRAMTKAEAGDATNLQRWRNQLAAPQNWAA